MTTQTRCAVKRRKQSGGITILLILIFCAVLFIGYRQLRAYSASLQQEVPLPSAGDLLSDKYIVNEKADSQLSTGALVLINKDHPYIIPENQDLVSIYANKNDRYYVRDMNVLIDASVMDHLNDMMEAFYNASDIDNVNVVAGHRTIEVQQQLYNESVAVNGAAQTAKFVALPGCSEHHTGLAVDLSIYHIDSGTSEEFDGSGDYVWLLDNAWRYGFIVRYSNIKTDITGIGNEPWHFRYIGVPHTYYITQNQLCLEEYIDLLHQYSYTGTHLNIAFDGQIYEVYFCSGTTVYLPENGEYTISGNNSDGFIVTVTIS